MIRFIIPRQHAQYDENVNDISHYTITADVPDLESALRRGGSGPNGFEHHTFIGIEVIIEHTTTTPAITSDEH